MAASKREKELARQRAERQAARRAAAVAKRRQRSVVLAAVAAVLVVTVGVGVLASTLSGGGGSEDPSTPAAAAGSAAPVACSYPDAGPASKPVEKPPTEGVETEGTFTATVKMNVGTVAFAMDAAATPCAVNSIRSLAHFSYYDKTPCHRLTSQGIFVLQCGDPTGQGNGGPGYRFADEALEGATYPRGTVAMANSGPDTNGSQFFLVYKDSQLGPQYTPVGKITSGLEVLEKVAAGGSTPPGDGKPKVPATITTLRTTKAA